MSEALDRPELDDLWERCRKRLEGNGLVIAGSPIAIIGDAATIDAICGLLGIRRPAELRVNVRLDRLEERLRLIDESRGLIDLLERRLGRSLVDRKMNTQLRALDKRVLWESAFAHPALGVAPELKGWLHGVKSTGLLKRADPDESPELLAAALRISGFVISDLGSMEWIRHLPTLAAHLTGDAHGLDPDRPLGRLVESAIRVVAGVDDAVDAWARYGIVVDEVNSSVLTMNLGFGTEGEPIRATRANLRLHRDRLVAEPPSVVFVFENPTIVAAAMPSDCRVPLIALDGFPGTVAQALLEVLVERGDRVLVHADFDAGGVAIINFVLSRWDVEPYQMSEGDYAAALVSAPSLELGTTVGSATWDPELADAMNSAGQAIHEEALLPGILHDLDGYAT